MLVAPKVQIGPQLPPELQEEKDDDEEDGEEGEIDRTIYTNGIGDSRGYYDDGAYIAMPEDEPRAENEAGNEADNECDEKELHEAYFSSIMRQYNRLRKTLHSETPSDASKRLSSTQATYAAPFGPKSNTNKTWANIMRNTDPHPLQLALMSKETVIRILRVLIGGTFLRRGHTLSERTSQWLWALLARLPDRGELNHAEIGWIRDLGRRAVLLGRSLAEMAALRDELEDGQLGVNEAVDASSSDEDVVGVDADYLDDMDSPDENDTPAEEANKDRDGENEVTNDKDGGKEVGEIQESEAGDVAMDIDSGSDTDGDGDAEEGEADEDLEAAKRGLLARLAASASDTELEVDAQEEARMRLRMNMRATLTMILTVAGEFYGQRDLLEFREPFVGM